MTGRNNRIVRPQDPVEQQANYSGREKETTRSKMSCWSMPFSSILFLSDTYGNFHRADKPIAERGQAVSLAGGEPVVTNLGFPGVHAPPEVTILNP